MRDSNKPTYSAILFSEARSLSTPVSIRIGRSMMRRVLLPGSWTQNIGNIDAPEVFARLTIPVAKSFVWPRNGWEMSLRPNPTSPVMQRIAFCLNRANRRLVNTKESESGR